MGLLARKHWTPLQNQKLQMNVSEAQDEVHFTNLTMKTIEQKKVAMQATIRAKIKTNVQMTNHHHYMYNWFHRFPRRSECFGRFLAIACLGARDVVVSNICPRESVPTPQLARRILLELALESQNTPKTNHSNRPRDRNWLEMAVRTCPRTIQGWMASAPEPKHTARVPLKPEDSRSARRTSLDNRCRSC